MPLLVFLRLPRAFLALSYVMTGYLLLRNYARTNGNQQVVPYLLAAGALLALADAGWTNIFHNSGRKTADEYIDAYGVSPSGGFFATVLLSVAGLLCAMTGGYGGFRAGLLCLFLILIKASLLQTVEVIGPMLEGAVRGFFVIIGMTAHPAFLDMLDAREILMPPLFLIVYSVVVAVLYQVEKSALPRPPPTGDAANNETASRLLDVRDETVDRSVLWFGGSALLFLPLSAAWFMPSKWLSWTLAGWLVLTLLAKLVPTLAYKTRGDLKILADSACRGGALLCGTMAASLAHYQPRELYAGWELSLPYPDEMVGLGIIVLATLPAWLMRRHVPIS